MHCVFSTKERTKWITPDMKKRLFPYMGGIAKTNKIPALEIGGVDNHVHLLLSIPSTITVACSNCPLALRLTPYNKSF